MYGGDKSPLANGSLCLLFQLLNLVNISAYRNEFIIIIRSHISKFRNGFVARVHIVIL